MELIVMIFHELDVPALFACKRVCRLFRDVDDPHLQYKTELVLAGMQDGPPSKLTSSERLRILKSHQEAWSTLSWTEKESVPMLVGDTWELFGGVLALADGPKTLVFRQLPSQLRSLETREWKIDVSFSIRDFSMDKDQDLLVIIDASENRKIHLLSLSTGKNHPSAASPLLDVTNLSNSDWSFKIKIFTRFVGVMFIPADEAAVDFVIYDWISGELVMHLCTEDIRCFAFLAGNLVMVAGTTSDQSDAYLEIYDLKSALDQQNLLCVFLLPEGGQDSIIVDLSISSDASSRPPPTAPFFVSCQDKLFTVTYETITENTENTLTALLFLPMSTILGHLSTSYVGGRDQFQWGEWGPRGTRFIFLDHEFSDVWICHTYGMKFVLACSPTPEGRFRSVRLYDFNNLSAKRDRLPLGHSTGALMDSSTIEISAGLFDESVHTHLPCRCVQRDILMCGDATYEAVMMNEDSLIAVVSDRREFTLFTF